MIGSKKETATAIEISSAHVKWVRFRENKDQPTILECGYQDRMNRTDEEITTILNSNPFFKKIRQDYVILIVSRQFAMTKRLRLPSVDPAELDKMVELQLVNKIPYELDDVAYHYEVLDTDDEGYTDIQVYVLNQKVIRQHLTVLEKANITADHVTLSSSALTGWYRSKQGLFSQGQDTTTFVVNMDVEWTEISFYCRNNSYLNRSIHFGAQHFEQQKSEEYFHEIKRSLDAFKKEHPDLPVQRLIVLTCSSDSSGLKDAFENSLAIRTSVINPIEGIGYHNSEMMKVERNLHVSLSNLVGTSLVDRRQLANLIPRDIQRERQVRGRKRTAVQAAGLAGIALAVILAVYGLGLYQSGAKLRGLERKLVKIRQESQQAQVKIDRVKAISQEIQQRVLMSDIFEALHEHTPMDITLRTVEVSPDNTLTLQGYARERVVVHEFQKGLNESKHFVDVSLKFATKRRMFNQELTDFKIVSGIQSDEEGSDVR